MKPAMTEKTVNIIEDLIPKGRKNRPGFPMDPQYITIHDTGNSSVGADAKAHARYLKGNDAARVPVSWHFTVDDICIVKHLPLNENGWHASDGARGPGNRTSIGVEICMNKDGDRAKAEDNAAWLVAKLLNELKLSVNRVVQHNYWNSKKDCPIVLRNRPNGWDGFLERVYCYKTAVKDKSVTTEVEQLRQQLDAATAENCRLRSIIKNIHSITSREVNT